MIVSHKHKLIFIKTHKTSTQTFMKFIKPHLGPDDIMAGDSSNDVNDDTKLNVYKIFKQTGLCAGDYVEKYGNHLPWFIVKRIVGDDIWNEYAKITIEREPKDRLVSLFCFLNSILIKPGLFLPSPGLRSRMKGPEIKEMLQKSVLDLYPDQVREYFEEINILQLSSPVLDLTADETYGPAGVELERSIYKQHARKLGLRIYQVDNSPLVINDKHGPFPYLNDDDICLRLEPFQKHQATEGQCRFLNYGYYHDGENIRVDHVVKFDNIGDNLRDLFNSTDIDIECNKKIYDNNSQNVHYRDNSKARSTEWWYAGKNGTRLLDLISVNLTDKFV